MTKQFLCVALGLTAFAVVPALSKGADIDFGKKYEGELGGATRGVGGGYAYAAEYTVTLKAGQKLIIDATAVGKARQVAVHIYDPKGVLLETTGHKTKSARLEFEEAPATGKYKVFIASPTIGAYTLRVTSPDAKKPDAKTRDEKIKRLRKELEVLEAEKALEARPQRTKP